MENLTNIFKEYAFNKGYKIQARPESGGYLLFEIGALQFLFYYDSEKDPNFFQVLLPNIDQLPDVDSQSRIDRIMQINAKCKTGKIFIIGKSVCVSHEQFIYEIGNLNLLFDRIINNSIKIFIDYKTQSTPQVTA